MKFLFLTLLILSLPSCTEKKPIPHEVTELGEKIAKMETELAEKDKTLKGALDHGLQIQTTHERELLFSRLERAKERMKTLWPDWEKERAAAAAAGGGGGGHH